MKKNKPDCTFRNCKFCSIHNHCMNNDMYKKCPYQALLKEKETSINVPLPYGAFVRVKEPFFERKDTPKDTELIGTITGFQVFEDGMTCWVSGYKESWCGEYLVKELEVLTEDEIKEVIKERG